MNIIDELKFSRRKPHEERIGNGKQPGYYHIQVRMIKRSAGQNTLKSASYRSSEKLTDEQTGKSYHYKREEFVLHTEILAPNGAPSWATEREKLWNEVEKVEKRFDAQLAREIVIALPHELTLEKNILLAREFIQENYVNKGMIADIAVHKSPEDKNIHAHIMLTLREITPNGFGKKKREWNDLHVYHNKKENYIQYIAGKTCYNWREAWEKHLNRAYEREGIQKEVSCKSLDVQREIALAAGDNKKAAELDRLPGIHRGETITKMIREGRIDESYVMTAVNQERDSYQAEKAKIEQELNRAEILYQAEINDEGKFLDAVNGINSDKYIRDKKEEYNRSPVITEKIKSGNVDYVSFRADIEAETNLLRKIEDVKEMMQLREEIKILQEEIEQLRHAPPEEIIEQLPDEKIKAAEIVKDNPKREYIDQLLDQAKTDKGKYQEVAEFIEEQTKQKTRSYFEDAKAQAETDNSRLIKEQSKLKFVYGELASEKEQLEKDLQNPLKMFQRKAIQEEIDRVNQDMINVENKFDQNKHMLENEFSDYMLERRAYNIMIENEKEHKDRIDKLEKIEQHINKNKHEKDIQKEI